MAPCPTECQDQIDALQGQVEALQAEFEPGGRVVTLETQVADLLVRVGELELWRLDYVDPTLLDHEGRLELLEKARSDVFFAWTIIVQVLLSKGLISTRDSVRILAAVGFLTDEELLILPETPEQLLINKKV